MDGDRLEGQREGKKEKHLNESKARLPADRIDNWPRPGKGTIKPLNIREAIEVMKILAPIAQDISEADNAARMMGIIFDYFEETDPTQTLRLASLLFHESLETLVELLDGKPSEEFFFMMVEAFAENSLADLVESIFALGFAKEKVSDAG